MYNRILVATIVTTKGLKGELKLKSYAEDFISLVKSCLTDEEGNKYSLYNTYIYNKVVVTKIKGINTKEEALELIGKNLYVNREELPNIEYNSYYVVDLIGASVFNLNNELIGEIKSAYNFGAGDIIEFSCDSKNIMLPFNEETITEVDIKNRKIILNDIYKEYM